MVLLTGKTACSFRRDSQAIQLQPIKLSIIITALRKTMPIRILDGCIETLASRGDELWTAERHAA